MSGYIYTVIFSFSSFLCKYNIFMSWMSYSSKLIIKFWNHVGSNGRFTTLKMSKVWTLKSPSGNTLGRVVGGFTIYRLMLETQSSWMSDVVDFFYIRIILLFSVWGQYSTFSFYYMANILFFSTATNLKLIQFLFNLFSSVPFFLLFFFNLFSSVLWKRHQLFQA